MIAFWEKNIVTEGVTKLIEFLNLCIYGLVSAFCGLFSDISNVVLFDNEIVQQFTRRIYVVLGIYMLFKLAISLMHSIINPDSFLDKEKGMQKIITRSVMALGMLILVPSVFSFALEKQSVIAEVVPRIIIGARTVENLEGQGELLASTALKAFIIPNKQCYWDENSVEYQAAEQEKADASSLSDVLNLASKTCSDTSLTNYKKQFAFEFNGIVSLFAGIFMIVSLGGYCIDIAIRSIKLGLLQLLAPIPIISYIDPKSEKDGAFGHWVKESTSTYLEIFIKLGILYFIIFILSQIASSEGNLLGSTGIDNNSNPFVLVFLIVGAFFFMGKASEFICNILGVKSSKNGSFFGKALGLATGSAIGAAGGLIAGGGLGGMAAGALKGLGSGATGKPLGAFNKGREIAAVMQGKEKPTSIMRRAENALMRRQAAKMGITDETLEEAKKARDFASSRFDVAQSLLSQAPDGSMIEWDGQQYTKEQFSDLVYNGKDSLSAQMKKRASVYDEMKAQGAKWQVGKAIETYSDKYRNKDSRKDYEAKAVNYKTPTSRIIPPSSSSNNVNLQPNAVPTNTVSESVLDDTPNNIPVSEANYAVRDRIDSRINDHVSTRDERLSREDDLYAAFYSPKGVAVHEENIASEKKLESQKQAAGPNTTASGIILNATESDFKQALNDRKNGNNNG